MNLKIKRAEHSSQSGTGSSPSASNARHCMTGSQNDWEVRDKAADLRWARQVLGLNRTLRKWCSTHRNRVVNPEREQPAGVCSFKRRNSVVRNYNPLYRRLYITIEHLPESEASGTLYPTTSAGNPIQQLLPTTPANNHSQQTRPDV